MVLTPEQMKKLVSAQEDNPPPYAPLGRRGAIDPPPWEGHKRAVPSPDRGTRTVSSPNRNI